MAGLLPIMYNHGVGSEVTQRIAAPMIGGVVSSAILSLIIIPLLYEIYAKYQLKQQARHSDFTDDRSTPPVSPGSNREKREDLQ